MSMNWRNPGMEYLTSTNIYDFGLRNETGLNAGSPWSAAQLANIDPTTYQYQRQDMSQMSDPSTILTALQNEATARQVFGLFGQTQGVGVTPVANQGPATSSLQPKPAQQLPVNSQLSGANLGLPQAGGLTPQTIGTLPVGSQLAGVTPIAGAGAGVAPAYTVTAGAAATPAASWWGKMLGNKQLMSGLITGAVSAYNQYKQKGMQKDMYQAQMRELDAQRAYQQDMYNRRQNSPQAQVARALLPVVLQFYSQRLGRRGVNIPLDSLLQSILGGNGGGQ